MPAGALDLLEVGQERVLAEILGLLVQHLAVADDRVERRPQLVAHARQKVALRLGPGLGRILGQAQLLLRPLAFDDPAELSANLGRDVQEGFVRLDRVIGEKLQDGDDVRSDEHRKCKRAFDPEVGCHRDAREIPVLRYVSDPRWFPTLQHPTWQARSGNEVGGLGHAPKRLEPFGVVEVPSPRGNQLPVGKQIGVPDRPSGVPAELIER